MARYVSILSRCSGSRPTSGGWRRYLAVAKLQADALVTVDAELAALSTGIVPVEPYEALFRSETATDRPG